MTPIPDHGPLLGRPLNRAGLLRTNLSLLLFGAGVIMAMMPAWVAAERNEVPELARSQTIYLNQLQIIRVETARKQESVNRVYISDLEKREAIFRESGELQGVLAIRGEKNRISPRPDSNIASVSPLPDEVVRLRAAYEERCRAIAVEEATAMQALIQRYTAHLDEIKRDLTRQDRVEDALAINSEIISIRNSSEFKVAMATLALPAEQAEEPAASVGDLATRLEGIRIAEFRFNSHNPVTPINELIGYLHHHGIGLRIEPGVLPISGAYTDHEGRSRYNMNYQSSYRRPAIHREVNLTRTTALKGLQSICDVFSLGYRLEADNIAIVSADDSRADWARQSMTADAVAAMFVDDNAKAVEYFSNNQMRLTGFISGMSRSVSGGTVAILHAPRPIRIEFASDVERSQVSRLQEAFRSVQEQAARMSRQPDTPRPIRRLGEDHGASALANSGPRITISVAAEYQSQMGLTIQFVRGSDLVWQRQY